jgi:TonB family protein
MKRFFFVSFLFHGVVLLFLSSWEIPGADRSSPKNIIEVSLVETMEKKLEENKSPGPPPERANVPLKKKIPQKKKAEAARRVAPVKKGEKEVKLPEKELKKDQLKREQPKSEPPRKEQPKQEEPRQEVEPTHAELRKEKPEVDGRVSPVDPIIKEGAGEPSVAPVKIATPTMGGEKPGELPPLGGNPGVSGGRGDSGIAFLASTGVEGENGGIPLGKGREGLGRGEGGPDRRGSIQTSSPGGDPVLSEIMRRIEGAKRYPRLARRMGIEGKATIRFKLKPNGKVDSVQVVETSGSDILDAASLETVQRAVPLPFKEGWLKVVIVFKIL